MQYKSKNKKNLPHKRERLYTDVLVCCFRMMRVHRELTVQIVVQGFVNAHQPIQQNLVTSF
ncbi:hypothetical protein GW750_04455 [bacterium]|nr:hypothetical protein [bacterium]